jgi:hypothetical protein
MSRINIQNILPFNARLLFESDIENRFDLSNWGYKTGAFKIGCGSYAILNIVLQVYCFSGPQLVPCFFLVPIFWLFATLGWANKNGQTDFYIALFLFFSYLGIIYIAALSGLVFIYLLLTPIILSGYVFLSSSFFILFCQVFRQFLAIRFVSENFLWLTVVTFGRERSSCF